RRPPRPTLFPTRRSSDLPLRDPAGQPAECEQHGEVVGGIAHRLVDEPGIEVDVRIELPRDEVVVLERDLLELECDLQLRVEARLDRKSTRLNSSHDQISY